MSDEQDDLGGEVEEVATQFSGMVQAMDPEDRAIVLTELASKFCMACGHNLNDDGECVNEDCHEDLDDEDEDEDDEGDEESEDDAGDEEEEDDDAGDDGDPDEEDEESEH